MRIRSAWLAFQFDEVIHLVCHDIETKLSQYKKGDDGKMVKAYELRELLDLEPIAPKRPPPPNIKAMMDSPWADVVIVPSSKKEALEPS